MKINGLLSMIKNRSQRERIYSTAEYWNAKAQELCGDAVSMWPNNNLNFHYHIEQMKLMEEELLDLDGKLTLDIGCGTGRLSRFLAERGAVVTGIDFSERAIALAKSKDPTGTIAYRVQSIFDLAESEAYDLLFSWGSLTIACKNRHELSEVMRRLRRSLKSRGRVFFLEPVHSGFVHRVLNMSTDEFCKVMRESGFEVDKVREMHFWPMRFVLAYVPWPRWITTPLYQFGQALMALPGFRKMGDYKAISARAE